MINDLGTDYIVPNLIMQRIINVYMYGLGNYMYGVMLRTGQGQEVGLSRTCLYFPCSWLFAFESPPDRAE